MMTPAELRAEIVYRTEERLALLGYYDKEETPEEVYNEMEYEAEKWARDNHNATWKLLYQTNP